MTIACNNHCSRSSLHACYVIFKHDMNRLRTEIFEPSNSNIPLNFYSKQQHLHLVLRRRHQPLLPLTQQLQVVSSWALYFWFSKLIYPLLLLHIQKRRSVVFIYDQEINLYHCYLFLYVLVPTQLQKVQQMMGSLTLEDLVSLLLSFWVWFSPYS